MKRREFITLLGGAARRGRSRRGRRRADVCVAIGVLATVPADDSEIQARMAAFHQGLQETGWIVGRNLRIDYRWSAAGDAEQTRKYANELIALTPEVVLAVATATVGPLQRVSGTTPIVFVQVSDPVGAGFVESLARPGGNTTGFTLFEFSMSAKWLELLKEHRAKPHPRGGSPRSRPGLRHCSICCHAVCRSVLRDGANPDRE